MYKYMSGLIIVLKKDCLRINTNTLLYDVLSLKNWPIKVNQWAWRYFNPGSQAALMHMLSDWARVQMNIVGRYGQHIDVKKRQLSP